MSVNKADVSVRVSKCMNSRGPDTMNLVIEDKVSGIQFLEIEMSMEQFGKLLAGGSLVDMQAELRGLENIGKKREYERASQFITREDYNAITGSLKYDDQKRALGQWLKDNHSRDGWHTETYLGSRDSIRYSNNDDGYFLNFAYSRYV